MITSYLRKTIRDFVPYTVAPIHESHVVNANENYLNVLSIPGVRRDVEEALASFTPQIYPAPMADGLRAVLSEYMGVSPENILCGNGGDELITYVLNTFLDPRDKVLIHVPTFDMYELGAETLGAKILKVEDQPGYRRDIETFLSVRKKEAPKLTFLCNPNNPTGELLSLETVKSAAEACEAPIVVDEAYMEFAEGESAVSLIQDHPNVIVLRTLSKAFGLAGMRCGYIVAAKETIDAVAKVKNPYNLNAWTQLFGAIAVKHREDILKTRDTIIAERDRMETELAAIPGVTAYPSKTNFILIQVKDREEELFAAWKKADILVKQYKGKALLPRAFRITVTSRAVNDALIRVMKEVYHA